MRKTLPATLPRPVPSDMLKRSSTILRNASASWPSGISTRGQRRAVLGRIGAQDLEAPRAHGAARRLGLAVVPREHLRQAFFEQHLERFVQAVEQVGRRRVGEVAVRVRSRASPPSPSTSAAASRACDAASALSLTALNESPGGSIRPFCEPATVTSTPHSSWR